MTISMYAGTNYNYLNTTLSLLRTYGLVANEILVRGKSALSAGNQGMVEVKCTLRTQKSLEKWSITISNDSITLKKGFLTRKSSTFGLPVNSREAEKFIRVLIEELGVQSPSEYYPSYYVENELFSILIQNGVTDFHIKEGVLILPSLNSNNKNVKVLYNCENPYECSFSFKGYDKTQISIQDQVKVPYSVFYEFLNSFLRTYRVSNRQLTYSH